MKRGLDNINVLFARKLLTQAHKLVRKHFPRINVAKDAWTHYSFNQYEFHGPDKFYWYGQADNAYEARYKGWMAWLKFKGIEE